MAAVVVVANAVDRVPAAAEANVADLLHIAEAPAVIAAAAATAAVPT